jgi:hypothetical protein
MRKPAVCTKPIPYGRIVSTTFAPLGASSRRIRGDEYHFIFAVGTKHHLCGRNLHGSKMFTLHLQTVDLRLFNLIYSLTAGSKVPIKNHLIRNHKSSWNAHESPVYRRLSGFIGFEISLNLDGTRSLASRVSQGCSSQIIAQKSHNRIFPKYGRTSTIPKIYNPKSLFSDRTPPSPSPFRSRLTNSVPSSREAETHPLPTPLLLRCLHPE